MKNFTQKITKSLVYLTITVLVGVTAVHATGTLTPTGTAGDDTHYSLKDIENKLTDFTATPTATTTQFTVPGSVTASFPTLTEIYDLLAAEDANIVPEKILAGTTIFGVEGSVVEGTPELEWSDEAPTTLDWEGARGYCTDLVEDSVTVTGADDWILPTISELLAGIVDDWTVDGTGVRFADNTDYWSGTEISAFNAWNAASSGGYVYNSKNVKETTLSVRCVR